MKKVLKVKGILRRGDFVGKGNAVSVGIFPRWGVANVTTVPLSITSWP